MFNFSKLISIGLLTVLLYGCGGGGGGTAAAPATESSSSQLAASVKLTGYAGLSLAQAKVANGTQTAALHKLIDWVTDAVFPKAYAQAAVQCNYDLLKLAGVSSDGTLEKLAVTTGADDCTTGFIDMYDGAKYILLTASGIYKDGLTCNLVLINKGDGNLYCVGERSRSIYKISGADSWKAYEKLQVSDDGNYMFLETDSTVFDQNGQVTGVKTKLLRFDLTDDNKGPVASTLIEGFQQSWLNGYTGAGASEYEGFFIKGYQGLNNGDLAILYQRTFGSSMNMSSKLNSFYYSFAADGAYTRVKFDDTSINTALNTAVNSGNAGNANNGMHWYDISCFFKDPASPDSFVFTIPYWYYAGGSSATSGMSALILRGNKPAAGDTTMPVQMITYGSAICSESSGMGGAGAATMAGNSNSTRPSKIGNKYYALQSVYGNGGNGGSWGQRYYLVSNSFDGQPDTKQIVSASSSWWSYGRKLYASKDFLFLQTPATGMAWTDNTQPGDTLVRIDPTATLTLDNSGNLDASSYLSVIGSNEHLSITKVATNKLDNIAKVTARDLADVDLSKIVGDIDEAGLFTRATVVNKDLQPISIVKL